MKIGKAIGRKRICIFHDKYCSQAKGYKYDDNAELRGHIR